MRELVAEVKALIKNQHGFEIDDETAEGLIDQTINYDEKLADCLVDRDDFDSYSEFSEMLDYERSKFFSECDVAWLIQMMGPRAAKIAGFRGVFLTDELGRSVAVDMSGREAEFKIFEGEDA